MPLAAPVTRTSCPPNRSAYSGRTPLFTDTAPCFGAPAAGSSWARTNSAIQEDSWSGRVRGTQCLAGRVRRVSCGTQVPRSS